jgi:glycosyltransferase involved in cell wall biosynthesis
VAKDFESKGGNTLLEAFLKVREVIPEAELIIVGSPPKLSEAEQSARGIRWVPLVERKQLLEEILPSFDVFAYPTQFDGMPLVLLEAMCRGIATASTFYRAIPEMLDHGRAGLLSPVGDAASLAKNLVRLLDPAVNQAFRLAARDYFERTYSADVVRNKLLSCYRATIES